MTGVAAPAVLPPPPPPQRPGVLRIGALLSVASSTMLVGALLGNYFAVRKAAEVWPPEGVSIPGVAAGLLIVTMLMSSFTAQWAVAALRADDRRNAYVAFGVTLVLAAAVVNGLAFIWSQMGAGIATDYGAAFYTLTVTCLVLLVAAMVALAVIAFRAMAGDFTPRDTELVSAGVTYWHFVVAVFTLVGYLVFFMEGATL